MEDGEITEDAEGAMDVLNDAANKGTTGTGAADLSDRKPFNLQQSGWSRRDANERAAKKVNFKAIFFL